jgi:DNA-directed RNA polymerase subunit H
MDISIPKCIKTLSEMFIDRGFQQESEEIFHCEFQKDKYIFNIDITNTFRIIFNLNNRFKFADIKKYFDEDFKYYILIISEKISTTNSKTIFETCKDVQIFEIKEMQFNITKHHLVPKHILINNETEINKIVELYNLKSRVQLPVILKSDPVARYLNAKSGNVVKVLRYSPSSGEHVIYRYCM